MTDLFPVKSHSDYAARGNWGTLRIASMFAMGHLEPPVLEKHNVSVGSSVEIFVLI